MKILIDDGMQIEINTGIGKYSNHLYKYLKKNENKGAIEKVDVFQFKKAKGKQAISRIRYLLKINSRQYQKMIANYDIVHYTNYAIPFVKNKHAKYAVTIHDLAAVKCRHTLPFIYGLYSKFILRYAIRHADIVFTVSKSIKTEIQESFPQYINKVYVVYPGLYDDIKKLKIGQKFDNINLSKLLDKKYFLFVGTLEKRKNISIILDAFIELKKENKIKEYKLVLAGKAGFGYEDFQKKVDESGLNTEIIITGYISDNDCALLYKKACAYIFPSIYEGFGSTQLECMFYETPLILSNIPTNIEISKNYGYFFDLNDLATLKQQMLMCTKLKRDLSNESKKVLSSMKWEDLVLQYEKVYIDSLPIRR